MKENFLKIIRVLLISIILTLLISSFTTEITQQSKKQNNSDDKELLPDWFLNPPVSIDNSCAYSIGISDPGLNNADAIEQAVMRAKFMMPLLYENDDKREGKLIIKSVSDYFVKGNETDKGKFENHYEKVTRFIKKEKYISLNFETVHTAFSKFNEAIVLLKYDFAICPKYSVDSTTVKLICETYRKETNKDLIETLEYSAKIEDKSAKKESQYLIKYKDPKDSISVLMVSSTTGTNTLSPIQAINMKYDDRASNEVDCFITHKYPEKSENSYTLKKGLWAAYSRSYFDAIEYFWRLHAADINEGEKNGIYDETKTNPDSPSKHEGLDREVLTIPFRTSVIVSGIALNDNILTTLFLGATIKK